MPQIVIAYVLKISEQPFWHEVVLPVVAFILFGFLFAAWYLRRNTRGKRSLRYPFLLSVSAFLAAVMLLSFTYKSLHGPTLEEVILDLSEQEPEYFEDVLVSMIQLSYEARVSSKNQVILGSDNHRVPEAIKKLSPHSIHFLDGEVKVLLGVHGDESLYLTLAKRAEDYYLLLNLHDEKLYITKKREIYPYSRVEGLGRTSRSIQLQPALRADFRV